MILKFFLNNRMIWMIFIKTLKINPNKNIKYYFFDDMIADMLSNKELNPAVTELPIRGRELNISLVFITQSYFAVPKDIRLCCTRYFIMKILNK